MSFAVRLEPSGLVFSVDGNQPVLAQGLRAGANMPYGCRMGTCCSCRGKILSGSVDLGNAHMAYLPQGQRDEGYALLCQATALSDLVIEVGELPPIPRSVRSPAIVKQAEVLAPDVLKLTLRLPLHLNLRYLAGQNVDLIFPGEVRRSYSIANTPRTEGVIDLEFHIRHVPGGLFTDRLFSGLAPRAKLEFEGPLGTFFLRDSDKPVIMLATGTGFAPIQSILGEVLPKRSGRRITLYWGGRTLRDIYGHDALVDLARTYPDFSFVPVLSKAAPDGVWSGRVGHVHRAAMQDHPDMTDIQVYACGGPAMVDAARAEFTSVAGLPLNEFFADAFLTAADLPATLA